jgi:uncharacterized membrane protein YeaQ/YmgE (transglycosylase-associated protein family)
MQMDHIARRLSRPYCQGAVECGAIALGSRQMQDAQAFFSQPGVGFFSMLIIGGLAGWIAGMVTESRHGILTNILVGIAGAFVGGELAGLLNIDVFGFFRTLISATVGAIVILFIWRQIRSTA